MAENARISWPDPPPPPRERESPAIQALLVLVFVTVLAAILLPIIAIQREHAKARSCLSDLKQVETGLRMYVEDYDNRLPQPHWMDSLLPYIKNEAALRCLEAERRDSTAFGRAFELNLLGRQFSKVRTPDTTDMIFDSEATHRNAVARIGWGIARPGRHKGGTNIGFVDGHVKWFSDSETARRWPVASEERTIE